MKTLREAVRSLPTVIGLLLCCAMMFTGMREGSDARITNGLLVGILVILWGIARNPKGEAK